MMDSSLPNIFLGMLSQHLIYQGDHDVMPLLRTVSTVSSPEKPLKRFGERMIPRSPPTTMNCGVGSKKMSGSEGAKV